MTSIPRGEAKPDANGEGVRSDYEHLMAVGNATLLLVQAARVSPPLIEAARLVDLEIHTLRDEIDRLRMGALPLLKRARALDPHNQLALDIDTYMASLSGRSTDGD